MTPTTRSASPVARFAALAAVVGLVVLVALALFAVDGGYRVTAVFENGGQLVKGNEVRVGGRAVGTVTQIELNSKAQAEVQMKLNGEITPLHEGTVAVVRATSLSGIANRYVSLDPGPNDSPELSDGGRIEADRTRAPVDLDQLFNTLDPKTRRGLRRVIEGQATYYGGRGVDAAKSLQYLSPMLSSSSRLTRELVLDDEVFERFIVDTSKVVATIAARRDDLAQAVANTNTTMAAIGDESAAFSRGLGLLPGTLRKANTTFVNLRTALDDLDVLVAESKPATKDLAPFLRRLRPLVADARPTIRDLRRLVRTPGANNDLIELTARLPRLQRLTSTTFPRTIRTLNRSQNVVDSLRLYTPDLSAWLTKFGQGAATYDANGHYARVQPVFSPFSFSEGASGGTLTPVPPANRIDGFEFNQLKRCPGGAVQRPPDGSAPVLAPGCDPSTDPPG